MSDYAICRRCRFWWPDPDSGWFVEIEKGDAVAGPATATGNTIRAKFIRGARYQAVEGAEDMPPRQRADEGFCHRYPVSTTTLGEHWCGEFSHHDVGGDET